jgi:hypothetical protein
MGSLVWRVSFICSTTGAGETDVDQGEAPIALAIIEPRESTKARTVEVAAAGSDAGQGLDCETVVNGPLAQGCQLVRPKAMMKICHYSASLMTEEPHFE